MPVSGKLLIALVVAIVVIVAIALMFLLPLTGGGQGQVEGPGGRTPTPTPTPSPTTPVEQRVYDVQVGGEIRALTEEERQQYPNAFSMLDVEVQINRYQDVSLVLMSVKVKDLNDREILGSARPVIGRNLTVSLSTPLSQTEHERIVGARRGVPISFTITLRVGDKTETREIIALITVEIVPTSPTPAPPRPRPPPQLGRS